MTPVDLHPDELLERARSESLTQGEAARLRAHVRQCSACAMEMAWSSDGLDDRAPSEEDALCAQRVIEQVWGSAVSPLEHAPRVPAPRRVAIGGAPVVVIGVLLSASVAAAAIGDSGRRWVREQLAPLIGAPAAPRERPRDEAKGVKRAAKRVPAAPPIVEPQPLAASRVEPVAIVPAPPAAATLRADRVAAVARTDRTSASRDAVASSSALLETARSARRAGDVRAALDAYDALERVHPDSRATRSSRIAHAQLLLDARGDATSALALYERYLRVSAAGPLAEEARLGRARSLERLGDHTRALAAWRELLAHHPQSIHATLARAQIAELSP